MIPIEIAGHNVVYAKNQPEYLPLPARRDEDGRVTTAWKLSWWERLHVLAMGKLYLSVLTFNQPLQPVRPETRDIWGA